MVDKLATRPFFPARPITGGQPNKYAGSYADRQRRFDSRSAQRWGDWSILGLSTPLLWLEADALLDESLLVDEAIIVDPWS